MSLLRSTSTVSLDSDTAGTVMHAPSFVRFVLGAQFTTRKVFRASDSRVPAYQWLYTDDNQPVSRAVARQLDHALLQRSRAQALVAIKRGKYPHRGGQ